MEENQGYVKKTPQDISAERAVLCCLLQDNSLIDYALSMLSDEAFYTTENKALYRAISFHANDLNKQIINTVTIRDRFSYELRQLGKLKEYEDSEMNRFFIDIMDSGIFVTRDNLVEYCNVVKEKWTYRKYLEICSEIEKSCYTGSSLAIDIGLQAQNDFFELAKKQTLKYFDEPRESVNEAVNRIVEAAKNPSHISGIPTGFKQLDEWTAGFQNSDLIIIAARPGVGKTSLSLSMALKMAKEQKKKVAYFSLEMATVQLYSRFISMETGINSLKLRDGNITQEEFDRILLKSNGLLSINFYCDDTSGISLAELRNKCKMKKAETGLDIVFIDYLQLMTVSNTDRRRYNSRQEEIAAISGGLKILAKELNIPIVAMAQINRASEKEKNRMPVLSDIRDSGSIEQDADIVIFLHKNQPNNDEETQVETDADKVVLNVAKHRNGKTGVINVRFDKGTTKYHDLDRTYDKDLDSIAPRNK